MSDGANTRAYSGQIKKRKEFSENEPITTDGKVYNVLLIGVDRRDDTVASHYHLPHNCWTCTVRAGLHIQ